MRYNNDFPYQLIWGILLVSLPCLKLVLTIFGRPIKEETLLDNCLHPDVPSGIVMEIVAVKLYLL